MATHAEHVATRGHQDPVVARLLPLEDVGAPTMNTMVTDDPLIDSVIDHATLFERFEGDLTLLREVADLFFEHYPQRLGELRAALACGDGQGLANAAHSLKGSVGNFAADGAFATARRLERLGREGDLSEAATVCAQLETQIAQLKRALDALC